MKKTLLALAVGAVVSTPSFANNMYINLPSNNYDAVGGSYTDSNTQTGVFNEFGFSQLLATSVYDLSDALVTGNFYDTNIPSELASLGIPRSGTAMDGSTFVSLALPASGNIDLDALSPLAPPLGSDNEGFLNSWELKIAYRFNGTLGSGGPSYTGGTFEVWFDDLSDDSNDRKVLGGTLMGSSISLANLNLFFDITFAESNFLFIEQGGSFIDASDLIGIVNPNEFVLDTNVVPPIPTLNQLLSFTDLEGNRVAVRQTRLDGSITSQIPEPGTIALLGLGLFGLGMARRRRS